MSAVATCQVYAKSLLADLERNTPANLPRRGVLVDWLRDFLVRSDQGGFRLESSQVEDLTAVHNYLVTERVPTTPRAALAG